MKMRGYLRKNGLDLLAERQKAGKLGSLKAERDADSGLWYVEIDMGSTDIRLAPVIGMIPTRAIRRVTLVDTIWPPQPFIRGAEHVLGAARAYISADAMPGGSGQPRTHIQRIAIDGKTPNQVLALYSKLVSSADIYTMHLASPGDRDDEQVSRWPKS